MQPRGQVSLEALLVVLAYATVFGVLVSALANADEKLGMASAALAEQAKAKKCSMVLNALYTNGGKIGEDVECVAGKGIVFGKVSEKDGKTRVEVLPHYG